MLEPLYAEYPGEKREKCFLENEIKERCVMDK
jgi:hypothetical protein